MQGPLLHEAPCWEQRCAVKDGGGSEEEHLTGQEGRDAAARESEWVCARACKEGDIRWMDEGATTHGCL